MDITGNRATRSWRSDHNHGRELMPAVVDSLAELSLTAKDVTHIAVALGPGGFSAVRVGISVALGLAVANHLPIIGLPTHDIELHPFSSLLSSEYPVYTLLPAGRNEVSWTRHFIDVCPSTGVLTPDKLALQIEPNSILCGEAYALMASIVDKSHFRDQTTPTRDPNSVLDIAQVKFDAGHSTPYKELRPIYARPPSITEPNPAK